MRCAPTYSVWRNHQHFHHSHWLLCALSSILIGSFSVLIFMIGLSRRVRHYRQAEWPLARRAVITALGIQNAYVNKLLKKLVGIFSKLICLKTTNKT